MPLKAWIKSALDQVIQVCLGERDLEFVWVGDDAVDPLQQAQTLNILVGAGIKTIGEARADLGLAAEAKAAPALGKFNPHHDERGRFTTADNEVDSGVDNAAKPTRQIFDASYQGDYHDLVLKDELEQYAKAGARCVSELRLQFAGVTARVDALCVAAAGVLIGVDVKTGPSSRLTPEQAFVYLHAMAGAGVVSPDGKLNLLGLPVGEPLPAFPIIIVYVPGPGEQKQFILPTPEPETR